MQKHNQKDLETWSFADFTSKSRLQLGNHTFAKAHRGFLQTTGLQITISPWQRQFWHESGFQIVASCKEAEALS